MGRYRKSAVETFEKAETLVRAWLEKECITRVDVYLNGLGDVGDTRCRLTTDGGGNRFTLTEMPALQLTNFVECRRCQVVGHG